MLNHAATARFPARLVALTASALLLLVAGGASALEGIDLSAAPAPTAEGECPRLIQIKYPFLACEGGQIGLSGADETWENSRQIPELGTWTESEGAYGPDLNPR